MLGKISMKYLTKIVPLFLLLTFIFTDLFSQKKHFQIIQVSSSTIMINAGSFDGVKKDFTGKTFKDIQVGGKIISIDTSRFKIISVEENKSEARFESQSPSNPVERDQRVEFDQELVPLPRQGTLRIESNPQGAEVYVDDYNRGITPITISLDPGIHRLGLQKLGYEPISEIFTIISEQSIKKSYSLSTPHTPTPLKFSLNVNSSPPDAKVYINGAETGVTPLEIEVQDRNIDITVEKDNYKTIKESVTLEEILTEKNYILEREKFNLQISTVPVDQAKVYINDIYSGLTIFDQSIKEGNYKIKIEKEGYRTIEEEIYVKSNITKEYKLEEIACGNLLISADPYAEVFIDGEKQREVPPILEISLPEGEHVIKFVAHKLNREKRLIVDVKKDERKRIHEKLK